MHIFKNTNYDFLRWRWHAIALSWVVIIAGIVVISTKGIPLGVEFAGGTVVIAQFDRRCRSSRCATALDQNFGGGRTWSSRTYGDPAQRQVMIRVPQVGAEAGASLEPDRRDGRGGAEAGQPRQLHHLGTEIVGPAVGSELTSKGIWAMSYSAETTRYSAF